MSTPLDFDVRGGVYKTYVPVRIVLMLLMISDVRYGMHTGTVRYGTELRPGFLFYVYGMCSTGIAVLVPVSFDLKRQDLDLSVQ